MNRQAADMAGTVPGREGVGATRVIAPDGRIVAEPAGRAVPELVVAEIEVGSESMLARWDVRRNPSIFRRGQEGQS
ncbi:hypothetical protein HCN51_21490 [Nonomuraea sp. FMUSA5-5]|uniref:CN hydrolase domain-containing protein n=1 Tax=Nonomuraea composti TaxID=2720023 RepID=A0ABX1B2F5_9ACTN|nr:hypothetical protein [Nonomuraea sp. FMUSA5-5]NJP92004.1 hypothetical protein [Nonomuraea sp. FMUSA5-5]